MTRPPENMDESRPRAQPLAPDRAVPSLADDVRHCLLTSPRSLPPKYFYDERGSILFDRICDTPEYYPTRTEQALLEDSAATVIRITRPEHLFELGSGTSRKTRTLLEACRELDVHPVYWPLDVSEEILVRTGRELRREYPWLDVRPLVGDYSGGLGNLPAMPGRELMLFLGGTIGNFSHADGVAFLRELAGHLDGDDHLLLGMDRVKDRAVLEAAYNDAGQLTAAFNLNMLNVLNRDLGAEFDQARFRHVAHFNEERSQIEMYLQSVGDQTVRISALGETLELRDGEKILTEVSRKFTPGSMNELLEEGGFRLEERFDAPDEWYSLALARPRVG